MPTITLLTDLFMPRPCLYLVGATAHETICREERAPAGKVTCGVQNETSGQELAVKYSCPLSGQLGTLDRRVLSDVSFEGPAIIRA